ncbi:MAG: energy-coupling factor ABC transporter ATP-binding protein [Dehalococcoidia bacterium]
MSDPPAIEIRGLEFEYPDGLPALRGIDLRVAQGEKVALIGPNGAGKSTLLMQLNGILRGAGSVSILGTTVDDRSLRDVRALVGLLFPNPDDQLFSPTVFDDVAFGPLYMGLPREEVERRANEALAQVGMSGFGGRMPHRLSMGQKKRVAIATVLAMGAPVLALDEPTANLAPGARRELIGLLRDLPQTMLVSTHDLGMVHDVFPRTIVMDEGRIVADGDTSRLLADESMLRAHDLEPVGLTEGPFA